MSLSHVWSAWSFQGTDVALLSLNPYAKKRLFVPFVFQECCLAPNKRGLFAVVNT